MRTLRGRSGAGKVRRKQSPNPMLYILMETWVSCGILFSKCVVDRLEVETPGHPIPKITVIAPGQVHVGLVELTDKGLLPLAAHFRLGILLFGKLCRFERL